MENPSLSAMKRQAAALSEAEQQLQLAIREAAKTGSYRLAQEASGAAETVQRLCQQVEFEIRRGRRQASSDEGGQRRETVRTGGAKRRSAGAGGGSAIGNKRMSNDAKSVDYPRFDVRRNNLIRVGWSKKSQSPYEHKVPKSTLDQIIEAMSILAGSGSGPFTAEQITNQTNQVSPVQVPSYQVYVVLGWLRASEGVGQEGRDGYLIERTIRQAAADAWKASSAS